MIGAARVHLFAEARVHGDSRGAAALRRQRAFDREHLSLMYARADLDRDGTAASLRSRADDVLDERGMRHESAAVAV